MRPPDRPSVWAFLAAILPLAGCALAPTPPHNRPQEQIVSVVSEVQLARASDIYRMPYPLDAAGKNVFESALERLDAWSRLHPGQFEDLVWFTKGLCHEKLARLEKAAECYGAVRSVRKDIEEDARRRKAVMEDLAERFRPASDSPDAVEFGIENADESRAQLALEEYKDTEWEPLVRVSMENLAVQKSLDLKLRRTEGAEAEYRESIELLIAEFSDSKRIHDHELRLGIYYEDLAREWLGRGEYGAGPEAYRTAAGLLDRAAQIYLKVAQADGYSEKLEAKSRMDTVEELSRRIERRLS